jgi:hypothetical protein
MLFERPSAAQVTKYDRLLAEPPRSSSTSSASQYFNALSGSSRKMRPMRPNRSSISCRGAAGTGGSSSPDRVSGRRTGLARGRGASRASSSRCFMRRMTRKQRTMKASMSRSTCSTTRSVKVESTICAVGGRASTSVLLNASASRESHWKAPDRTEVVMLFSRADSENISSSWSRTFSWAACMTKSVQASRLAACAPVAFHGF